MSSPSKFFATTPAGLELLLVKELDALGASQVREARGGVYFEGTLREAYAACLWSRLANRIVLPLTRFPASDPDQLYAGIRRMEWTAHLDTRSTFAVDFVSSRSAINHTLYGAQKVKDAIADYFRAAVGSRPSVDTARPDVRINVYLDRDEATVSIDLSGDSLHRRGYRLEGGKAPLKENLAAALLLRAGWPQVVDDGGTLIDPMCGSGTLLIEAAWMAGDHAPGLLRTGFGFEYWKQHEPALWEALRQEAYDRAEAGYSRIPAIQGYDLDAHVLRMAKDNIRRAGMAERIRVECRPARDARPSGTTGLVVVNPPYGERLGEETELVPVYAELGSTLKQHFVGWKASVFTGNPELAFKLGIRAGRYYSLYNGPIECRLFNFEIRPERFFIPKNEVEPTPPETPQQELMGQVRRRMEDHGGAEMLANRIRKNMKNLGRWARQHNISCYRLYDADLPEYAVAVDVYQGSSCQILVQEYEAPASVDPHKAEERLIDALAALPDALGLPLEQIHFRVRRRQKGTAQYEKLAEAGHFHAVPEGGHQFWVNFEDYLDTGLFLDHRLTRQRIQSMARGQRFLNLFAYTGSATVYAIKGGAVSSCTVDMSKTYLDWAARNLELNGLGGTHHELIQADCLDWLAQARSQRLQYDLIFLDPPTFSTSKRMETTLDIQRDHVDLIHRTLRVLASDGVLLFSTNCRKFKLDTEGLADVVAKNISPETLSRDYDRNPRIHQCWELRHR
ncbi:MAG: bifunctional 23S rRNA (guanine(2069)-N(7))-methyltransferase RlmK/23S rRNA (guanine(2445)-N(2))-methyltransferase RlmL [Methylococcaceae bacterium]